MKSKEAQIKRALDLKESDLTTCHVDTPWSIDPKTKDIWTDHARNIYNIFESCFILWERLAWPVQEECLKFGSDLFKQMNEDFKTIYVPGLHHIIKKDGVFDHQEIVLALNTLYGVFQWVKDLEVKLEKLFESLGETNRLKKRIAEAEDIVLEESDRMVDLFCTHQRSRFQKMIREEKFYQENDFYPEFSDEETSTALGYLNAVLKFVEINLDIDNADGSKSYKDLYRKKINEELFKVYENELMEKVGKSERKPEASIKLKEALKHTIDFRRNISLDERQELYQTFDKVKIDATPTSQLISQFLQHLEFDHESSRGNLTIEAKKDSYDRSIQVTLKSVSQLVPRKTKSNLNFSLSLSILPNLPEMKSQKYKTKTFKATTDHFFDISDDQDEVEEHNYKFEHVGDDQFLHIVVYDHSSANIHKVFRG